MRLTNVITVLTAAVMIAAELDYMTKMLKCLPDVYEKYNVLEKANGNIYITPKEERDMDRYGTDARLYYCFRKVRANCSVVSMGPNEQYMDKRFGSDDSESSMEYLPGSATGSGLYSMNMRRSNVQYDFLTSGSAAPLSLDYQRPDILLKTSQYKSEKDATAIDGLLAKVDIALVKSSEDSLGRTQYLATRLDDGAGKWLALYLSRIGGVAFLGYEALKKELRKQFYPPDHGQKCHQDYSDLKQTGSIRAYVEKFSYLLNQLPSVYQAVTLDHLVCGLKAQM
ncbi:hypothetical protein BABINDRAFT_159384, partial [Babjeviella inositovora NRRL Y-12698]